MAVERQWNAESLLDMGRQAYVSRIFLSAVELDLFDLLSKRSLSAEEVAKEKQCDLRAMRTLLNALSGLDFLQKEGNRYKTPPDLTRWLSSESEESILPMLRHGLSMWETWSRLTDVVRTGKPAVRAPIMERKDDAHRSFILGMHVIGRERALAFVAALDLTGVARLIDVGGASGTYVLAFLKAHPEMRATLFDLPQTITLARERLSREGVLDRVTLVPGDFYRDDLPGGHDLALLSAIIHQNSRQQNRDLFKKVHASLVYGGRVLIRDHVMDSTRTKPASGAVFAVNMLVGTEGGGTYTLDEIREDLESAGFSDVRLLQEDTHMDGLVEARKI
jgi:predicted O-methyltransferase YrrM